MLVSELGGVVTNEEERRRRGHSLHFLLFPQMEINGVQRVRTDGEGRGGRGPMT